MTESVKKHIWGDTTFTVVGRYEFWLGRYEFHFGRNEFWTDKCWGEIAISKYGDMDLGRNDVLPV